MHPVEAENQSFTDFIACMKLSYIKAFINVYANPCIGQNRYICPSGTSLKGWVNNYRFMDEKSKFPKSEVLSDKEIRRYIHQIHLSGFGLIGQEKIKQAKILVIGAGGKGSSALQNLASAGVGTIGICDNYPVTEDQLSRQHLYGDGDLGKQKAIISRQKLVEINHLVKYKLHNVCLSEQNIDLICSGYDLLVDATDNFPAHYLINDAAIRLNKPFVYGAGKPNKGFVSVFNYKEGPSLRCCFPKPPENEQALPNIDFACQVMVISIIGSVMANETLKVILGLETKLSSNLLSIDAVNYAFSLSAIRKNPKNFK